MEQRQKIIIHKLLNKLANYVEFVIAIVLISIIAILLVQLVFESFNVLVNNDSIDFSIFLSNLLNLIIGLEFTRMLCRHSPGTIIEVLTFVTAKQIIVSESGILETFLGVLSIGVLFLLRKYILPEKDGTDKSFYISQIFRGKRKVSDDLQDTLDEEESNLIEL